MNLKIQKEIAKLQKSCHSVYNSLENLEKGKRALEKKHQTTSMSA